MVSRKSRIWLSDFTFSFHFYALEKEMVTHSNVLAWRIPWVGSHRVGHDWSDLAAVAVNWITTFSPRMSACFGHWMLLYHSYSLRRKSTKYKEPGSSRFLNHRLKFKQFNLNMGMEKKKFSPLAMPLFYLHLVKLMHRDQDVSNNNV